MLSGIKSSCLQRLVANSKTRCFKRYCGLEQYPCPPESPGCEVNNDTFLVHQILKLPLSFLISFVQQKFHYSVLTVPDHLFGLEYKFINHFLHKLRLSLKIRCVSLNGSSASYIFSEFL